MIENAINIIPPITFDIFPILLFIYFPINNPKSVNIPLNMENVNALIKWLSYIIFNPIPAIKLSMLTASANNNIDNIPDNFLVFLSSLSSIINNPNAKNVINVIYFGLNLINLNIMCATLIPNNGIMKWNIPTISDRLNIFL